MPTGFQRCPSWWIHNEPLSSDEATESCTLLAQVTPRPSQPPITIHTPVIVLPRDRANLNTEPRMDGLSTSSSALLISAHMTSSHNCRQAHGHHPTLQTGSATHSKSVSAERPSHAHHGTVRSHHMYMSSTCITHDINYNVWPQDIECNHDATWYMYGSVASPHSSFIHRPDAHDIVDSARNHSPHCHCAHPHSFKLIRRNPPMRHIAIQALLDNVGTDPCMIDTSVSEFLHASDDRFASLN